MDAETFLTQLYDQIHTGGAVGNATGRNIHQRSLDEAVRLTKAISAITLADYSVEDSLGRLQRRDSSFLRLTRSALALQSRTSAEPSKGRPRFCMKAPCAQPASILLRTKPPCAQSATVAAVASAPVAPRRNIAHLLVLRTGGALSAQRHGIPEKPLSLGRYSPAEAATPPLHRLRPILAPAPQPKC